MAVESDAGPTAVALTEVEAYMGEEDPASHAFRGPTSRNRSMFGPPGTLYVYRAYGIHWCANVATGATGLGQAILLREGIPMVGEELMRARRRRNDHLTDGPGRLAQALGLSGDHDGADLLGSGPVRLTLAGISGTVESRERVGIAVARDRLWRFVLNDASQPGSERLLRVGPEHDGP